MLLARLFERLIQSGELTLIDADGEFRRFGDAGAGPAVTLRLHDRALHWKLFLNPRLHTGEAYVDGRLTIEGGSIYEFLDLIGANLGIGYVNRPDRWVSRSLMLWRRLAQANPLGRARKNVAHHYDLSGALYDLFLDADRQYSCAYFPTPGMTLEAAQEAKKRHLAAKLLLAPGQRVLDIGSGWGGLALYLARTEGVEVTGITLSREQHRVSENRAAEAGLDGRVRFCVRDYREECGTYDRIVSVGMFEHVGLRHYREFFDQISKLLCDDGVALLHTIAHMDPPSATNPWTQKYIFPGGYCPSLSEILRVMERAGLWVTDVEVLRLHYAETLRAWRERFTANWDAVAAIYDERFCRMWEFYLAGSEVAFRHEGFMVAQIQLAKSVDAVPLTRDYITDQERGKLAREDSARFRLREVER